MRIGGVEAAETTSLLYKKRRLAAICSPAATPRYVTTRPLSAPSGHYTEWNNL